MKNALNQVRLLTILECRLRLRRGSTVALFLLLCVSAFLLLPDPSSGATAFQMGAQRVLLTSAATALASGMIGSLLLLMVGFYLVSSSVSRDARTGVGRIIASTPVSSAGYLAGKFLGNTVYLGLVTAGFMAACMGMQVVRGEGPLEPLVFVETFAVLFFPLIPCVAALALLFESVPSLAGRMGDVLYFFLSMFLLTVPAIGFGGSSGPGWEAWCDIGGLGFTHAQITRVMHASSFSIGVSHFDPSLPPVIFPGMVRDWGLLAPRLGAALLALPLIALAVLCFRRFDPASGAEHGKRSRFSARRAWESLTALIRRRLLPRGGWAGGTPSFARAVGLDLRLSLALMPFAAVAALALAAVALLVPGGSAGVSQAMFWTLVPFLAAVPTRDRSGNTMGLILTAPLLRRHFVLWKFCSALALTLLIGAVPLARVALESPEAAGALVNGMVFIAAAATCLGILTGTPKTFSVLFLLFLYLVSSSRTVQALDFAGWNGCAAPAVLVYYALTSLLLVVAALGWMAWRMRRERIRN